MKEGWEYKKLGEVCEILDNLRKPVTKKDRTAGIYPYYGASGIQDYVDSYIFDGRFLLVGEDGAKWGASDKSAFIIEGKSWVNNHAHILKVSDKIIDILIEYYLTYKDLSDYITGAVVPKLTQKSLVSIPIPIPPLTEQERIVSELDLLTSIINKQKAQLKELDSLAQSIFYDMFGDPIENPKGWEVKNLGYEFDVSSGGTPSTKNYEYWNDGKISWIGSNMCQNK
ncbi:MAG: restriction endonuclease subunit S, partial [Prevotella sp.]|nr:restriction endonuclease subunit S [Prevotella sp.]